MVLLILIQVLGLDVAVVPTKSINAAMLPNACRHAFPVTASTWGDGIKAVVVPSEHQAEVVRDNIAYVELASIRHSKPQTILKCLWAQLVMGKKPPLGADHKPIDETA